MEFKGRDRVDLILWVILFFAMIFALYMALVQAPSEKTMHEVQRIFYFHVPSGITAMTAFFINFIASMMYLIRKNRWWDNLALACAEIGVMMFAMLLVTGPIWAKYAWGIWWTWSPRLTSSLILWMLYVAYLLIRNYVVDPDRRAMTAAVFGIIAFVDTPIVWFSIRLWRDQHPSPMLETGGLSPAMWPALLVCWGVFQILFLYLVRRRFFLESVRQEVELLQRDAEFAHL